MRIVDFNLVKFRGKKVQVETEDFTVTGILEDYEPEHGGNLVLKKDGMRILVRGTMVTSIKELKD